jgi:membrane protein
MKNMFYPNLILIIVSLVSFLLILGVFIFFKKKKYKIAMYACIVLFLSISLQILFFVVPISILGNSTSIENFGAIEYFYIILSILSSISIISLLPIFYSLSENEQAISFVLGAFQVAIFMSLASMSNISVHLKILLNIYYLCIPALAIHELITEKHK